MPIYEYECPVHGRFEVSQRITEAALSFCTSPECSQPVRKLISHSSFALKGSGWYATDYGRSTTAANGDKAKGDKAAGDKAKDAGTDKPEAKAEKADKAPLPQAKGPCGSEKCAGGCAGAAA